MARRQRRVAGAVIAGALLVVAAASQAAAVPRAEGVAGTGRVAGDAEVTGTAKSPGAEEDAARSSSLVMVLDSSGSMAGETGSGGTRIEAAREAVGTVVDALPDGYPTGLRVYGADRAQGCDDTRLARPVEPLDRAGLKEAVAGVEPRGDTPIGLSLRKAAEDLPEPAGGPAGRRTILLVSDGEDNCGSPDPCEVAGQLGGEGVGLRIDAIGFQVEGKAREQLECIAGAGNGRYYDAPDAEALARQLQRAGQLSVDGYRFQGKQADGTPGREGAPVLEPGQYLDTLGPNEKRYYAVELDGVSTADFSATAVPQPGAPVEVADTLRTELHAGEDGGRVCESSTEMFGQDEGATPITSGVSRIPDEDSGTDCHTAGRYWLAVERGTKKGSDSSRWPVELTFHVKQPLKRGTTPAQSEPEYGAGGKDAAALPGGTPRKVAGGTGFNDARKLGTGVWRDTVLPSQTLWYKVPVGWGQQLRYDVEFANEPTVEGGSTSGISYGATQVYTPDRQPVGTGTGEFSPTTVYDGKPRALRMGTVPVAWTNRYESDPNVVPVHDRGDFYIAVTLGAEAAGFAENPQIGVVLRVAVLGTEKTGPEHGAPAVRAADSGTGAAAGTAAGDGQRDGDGGGLSGPLLAAAAGGTGILLAAGLAVFLLRSRRRRGAAQSTRGDSW
ncbi:VWA domain-containing protein [Streptomyces sp. Ru87]|uniref:vWA domain-containing protein n=1 Tax=Streptomyces sp. Ru87 TaxID=2044307 RepID=UPI000BF9C7F0|nr:VWA domain-containing protein [Streptomyces sp. Ru87]PGH49407.1 hypothetical protein CRI70_17865 [Streptomyces sp. Ru87]